ncbi:ATP-dependent DNA helicase pcrA [Chitinispirillum alkaliphilum]|nr:ATP-dependent DNA helicase pcrA [Chitinispirillum alkaliphilum]
MKFIADIHIHSHFSMATSSQLNPPMLDLWARKKGIKVIGTGDAVHPGWMRELKENLTPAENGLFLLKKDMLHPEAAFFDSKPFFMLTSEISCIYKYAGKVRKVHHIIACPDFQTMEKIQAELEKRGKICSDGRPILGMDSRDLLEVVLSAGKQSFLIPAHIWTPWFSVLGARSGFDSIEQCYRDLSSHIFALETGLSSDPPMNWSCSILDKFALISNSDAHSPANLGREATIFDTQVSFEHIVEALKAKDDGRLAGTLEYFPEEGKYFLDGHRKCKVRWSPEQTRQHNGICPVCAKPVTTGVLNRVMQLADRDPGDKADSKPRFYSFTPLKGILSQITGTSPSSKKTTSLYEHFLKELGSEFVVLFETPLKRIAHLDPKAAQGIALVRAGAVQREGGYDGEYGSIRVFPEL